MKMRMTDAALTDAERAAVLEGEHGLGPEAGLARLAAHHAQHRADVKEAAATRWAHLEGEIQTKLHFRADAEKRRRRLALETRGEEPPLAVPLVMVVAAGALAFAETIFLRPIFDGVGITNPIMQFAVAAGTVLGWMVLVELALVVASRHGNLGMAVGASLLIVAALGLASIGWWRHDVLVQSVHSAALHQLFEEHPTTTTLALVILTALFPFAAAFSLWCYLPTACAAVRYRRAMQEPLRWHAQITAHHAEQRALGASLNMALERIDAEEREDREGYLTYYRLGTQLNGGMGAGDDLSHSLDGGYDGASERHWH